MSMLRIFWAKLCSKNLLLTLPILGTTTMLLVNTHTNKVKMDDIFAKLVKVEDKLHQTDQTLKLFLIGLEKEKALAKALDRTSLSNALHKQEVELMTKIVGKKTPSSKSGI